MRGSCLKNDSHQIFIKIHVGIERVFFYVVPEKRSVLRKCYSECNLPLKLLISFSITT